MNSYGWTEPDIRARIHCIERNMEWYKQTHAAELGEQYIGSWYSYISTQLQSMERMAKLRQRLLDMLAEVEGGGVPGGSGTEEWGNTTPPRDSETRLSLFDEVLSEMDQCVGEHAGANHRTVEKWCRMLVESNQPETLVPDRVLDRELNKLRLAAEALTSELRSLSPAISRQVWTRIKHKVADVEVLLEDVEDVPDTSVGAYGGSQGTVVPALEELPEPTFENLPNHMVAAHGWMTNVADTHDLRKLAVAHQAAHDKGYPSHTHDFG